MKNLTRIVRYAMIGNRLLTTSNQDGQDNECKSKKPILFILIYKIQNSKLNIHNSKLQPIPVKFLLTKLKN
jgi:hypothetical protein